MGTKWQRLLTDGLAVAGLGLMLSGLTGVMTTRAEEVVTKTNPGEITIHVESDCSGSDTDPKPGQQFWVGGKNFESGTARWLFVTDGTNASDPVVIGAVSVGTGSSFCVGPYTLTEGHYKAYVSAESGSPVNSEKTKVFKVEGVENTTPDTNPPETQPPVTQPPETNPPETNPPETNPPETNPPETNPPETQPPVTQPPETNPPETQPPVTDGPPSTDVEGTGVTTSVESEAPTTTVESEALPVTGGGSAASIMVTAGLMLGLLGLTLRVMARRSA